MQLSDLGLDRNLIKASIADDTGSTFPTLSSDYSTDDGSTDYSLAPSSSSTASAGTSSSTSTSTRAQTSANNASGVQEGTVLTNCIVQTSALAHRVQISDNEINFYNDTYTSNGVIKGDTSRLIFGRLDSTNGTYTMEQRTSTSSDLDNVLSWYASSPASGHYNWMFIGENGDASNRQRNLGGMFFNVNTISTQPAAISNGVYAVGVSINGADPVDWSFITADTRAIDSTGVISSTGVSTVISAYSGGFVGMAYNINSTVINYMWYAKNSSYVSMGATIIPDTDLAYDIGDSTHKVKDIHVGGRLNLGKVSDAGPMTATAGTVGDLVYNSANNKAYVCVSTGSPAIWSVLN